MGPCRVPNEGEDYYSGETGSLFFAPNAWPDTSRHPSTAHLRPAMETYFARMVRMERSNVW